MCQNVSIGASFHDEPLSQWVFGRLESGAEVESLRRAAKTIVHIPNVNPRESTQDKIKEVEHIIHELGEWQGTEGRTGFQLVRTPEGKTLKIANLVDDNPLIRERVSATLRDSSQKDNRDSVDIINALGMAKEGFNWIWCEIRYDPPSAKIAMTIG